MSWLSLFLDTATAGCTDAQGLVDVAKSAIVEGRLEDAERAISQMEGSALGCGPSVSPDLLARFWLAEGAALAFSGDRESAADSFRAAGRVKPGYWNPELGPVVEGWYKEALAAPAGAPGELALSPAPQRYIGVLDGMIVAFPVAADAGLHLIEVGPSTGPMKYGKFVYVEPGQRLVINTGLAEEVAPVVVEAPPPPPVVAVLPPAPVVPEKPHKPAPVFAIAGGVLAAGAIGSAVMWSGENGAMRDATTLDALDAARGHQIAYGATGLSLVVLSGAAFTAQFAF